MKISKLLKLGLVAMANAFNNHVQPSVAIVHAPPRIDFKEFGKPLGTIVDAFPVPQNFAGKTNTLVDSGESAVLGFCSSADKSSLSSLEKDLKIDQLLGKSCSTENDRTVGGCQMPKKS